MRRFRSRLLSVVLVMGVLGTGTAAASQLGWILPAPKAAEANEKAASEPVNPAVSGTPDEAVGTEAVPAPGIEPVETVATELANLLSESVLELDGFPSDLVVQPPLEVTAGTDRMLIATFVAPDHAQINVVVQRVPKPIPQQVIDPAGKADLFQGPDGATILTRDDEVFLQVIATSPDGIMANVIVDKITGASPGASSQLASISAETAQAWALSLLETLQSRL